MLLLKARGMVEDRVEGLDAGADDYLVKPFSLAELKARLRALRRRSEQAAAAATEARFGEVHVDLQRRRVTRGKLEPDPERPRFILTEPKVGYRLVKDEG